MYNAIEDNDLTPKRFAEIEDETSADHCRVAARVAVRIFGGEARDQRVKERMEAQAVGLSSEHKVRLRTLASHLMAERIKLERNLEASGSSTEMVADIKAVIYNIYDFTKLVTA